MVDNGEKVGEGEWIQRMLEYLLSEEDVAVTGKRIAIITSSLSNYPSSWFKDPRIASLVSRIGSRAEVLYFVVSSQEEQDANRNNGLTEPNPRTEQEGMYDKFEMLESIELKESLISTSTNEETSIDVIVLSTTSQDVIHDDPFVNEFLRLTDAAICMSSDCTDKFSYYARLQEGADITLW